MARRQSLAPRAGGFRQSLWCSWQSVHSGIPMERLPALSRLTDLWESDVVGLTCDESFSTQNSVVCSFLSWPSPLEHSGIKVGARKADSSGPGSHHSLPFRAHSTILRVTNKDVTQISAHLLSFVNNIIKGLWVGALCPNLGV